MLNFTEHMKQIIQLAEQSLIHAQAEKFEPAAADLVRISTHTNEAIRQLDELSFMKEQRTEPDNVLYGGPEP